MVGGGVDFSFQTCSPELEFRQTQGGLHTWCRRVAGSVACSAGIKPAELLFDRSVTRVRGPGQQDGADVSSAAPLSDASAGKMPAAHLGSEKYECGFYTSLRT